MHPRTKSQYNTKHVRRSLFRAGERRWRISDEAVTFLTAIYHAAKDHAEAWAFGEANFSDAEKGD